MGSSLSLFCGSCSSWIFAEWDWLRKLWMCPNCRSPVARYLERKWRPAAKLSSGKTWRG